MNIRVLKFGAKWCHQCHASDPIFNKVSKTMNGVEFKHIDIEDDYEAVEKHQVYTVPTIVILKGEEEMDRIQHGVSEQMLKRKIENASR